MFVKRVGFVHKNEFCDLKAHNNAKLVLVGKKDSFIY
jgi:hypothetical protein